MAPPGVAAGYHPVMADFRITELSPDTDFEALRYWDVVIVGAGPAGLTAALTTAHRGLTTLVIEAKDQPGGQPQFLYGDKRIVDVPGFPDGITGEELSARVYRQAVEALVQFRFGEELTDIEDTEDVEKQDRLKRVITDGGTYLCRKVILALGLLHFPRRLPVLDGLESKKVFYKMPKIGDYEGQRVAVVGGGDIRAGCGRDGARAAGGGRSRRARNRAGGQGGFVRAGPAPGGDAAGRRGGRHAPPSPGTGCASPSRADSSSTPTS